jgi:hypothetical protein
MRIYWICSGVNVSCCGAEGAGAGVDAVTGVDTFGVTVGTPHFFI